MHSGSSAPLPQGEIVPVRDFSGLVISVCALASAPAMAPIDSLRRCMITIAIEIETHRARL